MNALRGFLESDLVAIYGPGTVAGLAIAIVCALLSPLVVLKRLSFVGQGISHAAFGGVGIAAVLAVVGGIDAARSGAGQFGVVLLFCLGAALLIAWLIERGASQADSSIGIVLVASMTLGAILIQWSIQGLQAWQRAHPFEPAPIQGWESILFGSILGVAWIDGAVAWAVGGLILAVLWWFRRPMAFWAFDEAAAPAFGVPASAMKYLLVILLTLAIVTAMKLAGVVLATAVLVLPGAAALRLSDRMRPVLALSLGIGIAGVAAGLALSMAGLPPGACIVAVLVALFGASHAGSALMARRTVA